MEDIANVHIRLLLYECFYAVASIVRQFHRPGPDSTAQEMTARRRLAKAMNQLNGIDDGVKRLLATSRDDTFELGLPRLTWESR